MNTDLSTAGGVDLGSADDFEALQAVITALRPLASDSRNRVLDAAATFLGGRGLGTLERQASSSALGPPTARTLFSQNTSMSPKEFLLQKQPKTDVERMACLGYYLTHYLDQPHFKTLDLSKLNTEAAQPKFSNAAQSANNAVKTGYLVPSTRGNRQLSASGEQFVLALPDRDAARAAMAAARPRRRARRSATKTATVRNQPSS